MGRVLGIDYGHKRVGLALSDGLGITAQPLDVVKAADLEDELRRLVESNDIELVVVGLPVSLSGEEGRSAAAARGLADRVAVVTGKPVEMWNEQFTSVEAERALVEAGARRDERRRVRDKVAAAVMLQGFLDAQSRT